MTDTKPKRYTGVIVYDWGPIGTIRFEDDLDYLHKLIACDCLDIPRRYVGGMEYRIICDDCGFLNERPITAIHSD